MLTLDIPLQIASKCSWPDTVRKTGLSKYSRFVSSLLFFVFDLVSVILNTSPPPSQSLEVRIGVWI